MADRYSPEDFAEEFEVSKSVMDALHAYDACLMDWQSRMNLVARSTLEDRWDRHFRDSAQLFALLPTDAEALVDFGSGAGFPGLVLAAMGRERGLKVSLVESIGKKAAFLSAAGQAMGLVNLSVIPQRIESTTISPPDVITARALASLVKLCGYAAEIANEATICLFPKGQDVECELTEATKYWNMDVEQHPSLTNMGSAVLLLRNLTPKSAFTTKSAPTGKQGKGRRKK